MVSSYFLKMHGTFLAINLEYAWHIQDIVTWNAMMAGYIEHGHFDGVWIVLTDGA